MAHRKHAAVGLGLVGVASAVGASFVGAPAYATSPTDSANVIVAAHACVGPKAISSGEMLVDGKPVAFGDGKKFVQGGSTVTVNFTVAPNCNSVKFGLAAYANPIRTFDPTYEQVQKQTYLTSTTITKSAGESASLTIKLPAIKDCLYQVDFFSGNVIPVFTQDNYYGSPEHRLISVVHIEDPDCDEVLPDEEERPTPGNTTSTSTSTTTSTSAAPVVENETITRPTTSLPDEVLAEEIVAVTTTAPAEVLAEDLANTGGDEARLIGAAGAFAVAGGALTVLAGALRRRRTAYSARHLR